MTTTQYADSRDGAQIAFQVSGPVDAPSLTFSHGLAADKTLWDPQVEHFSKDFRVIAYDARGHGESSATPGPYSFELLADDVIAIWNALGIERGNFVGLSLGGSTGLALALNHQDRLGRMVLSNCRSDVTPEWGGIFVKRIDVVREQGVQATVDESIGRWFGDKFKTEHPVYVANFAEIMARTSIEGYIGCVQAVLELAYGHRLSEIATQTLVIDSEFDHAPKHLAQSIARTLQNGELALVPNAGHMTNVEEAALFNDLLREFFTRD